MAETAQISDEPRMRAEPTSGPVEVRNQTNVVSFITRRLIASTGGFSSNVEDPAAENGANAELIAEAFTVRHQTGLTPRQLHQHLEIAFSMQRKLEDEISQLAGQRDELLVALGKTRNAMVAFGRDAIGIEAAVENVTWVDALIAKCEAPS